MENCFFYISRTYEFLHRLGHNRPSEECPRRVRFTSANRLRSPRFLAVQPRQSPLRYAGPRLAVSPGSRSNWFPARLMATLQPSSAVDLRIGNKGRTHALSPLLCHVLGWRLRRQGDPGVTRLLPHPDVWRGEIRIGEVADGNSDVSGKAFVLPVHRGAACRAEIKGQRVATLGCSHPRRSFTGDSDLLTREARLVTDHGAGAALAFQAMAHGDARWFAFNRKVKLPAAACGASGGHGSAPRLSICVST
jgi:hypothetical protein